jgi:hypothetical protein
MTKDILLDNQGDIFIGETGDISVKHSVRQEVKILLQWFFAEWRFGPELGLPYYEEVFVKNPNTEMIARIVRTEALKADGVNEIRNVKVEVDRKTRGASIKFTIITDYGSFREEVAINV